MHEMSLVISILDIAEAQARDHGAQVINSITVSVGELAGVEKDALEFCFTAARMETMAAAAELVIEEIEGLGHCPACGQDGPASALMAVCSLCGDGVLEIRQGRELSVRSINVD